MPVISYILYHNVYSYKNNVWVTYYSFSYEECFVQLRMSDYIPGVSCDICMRRRITGRKYKCLICYDFDICAECYDNKRVSAFHSCSHPCQCILTPELHGKYHDFYNILAWFWQWSLIWYILCTLYESYFYMFTKYHVTILLFAPLDSYTNNKCIV